jgi:hypothetical protein
MKYFDLVAQLPLPTPDQTARFAEHVADNHSWYKHLPFFPPGAGFVLFLNPHAGCGVREADGAFSVYDIEQGDYFEHHSRLSTGDYRQQFGHWDYWVDDNPRVIEPQEGPWIYRPADGQRDLLPSDVKQQWSCRLTAFLKPSPAMFRLRPSELYHECETFLAQGKPRVFSRVWQVITRKPGNSDADASRYQDLANKAKHPSDLVEDSAPVYSFFEAEAGVQRKRLLNLLHEIRDVCASVDGKYS